MMTFTNAAVLMAKDYDILSLLPVLESGGILLFPTDTVWSVGCDARNTQSIENIKNLCSLHPETHLEVLVSDVEMLKTYVPHLHPRIETLLQFHTRPVTIIYENVTTLPQSLTSADGSLAIRITNDDFCQDLIAANGAPIIAQSAAKEGTRPPGFFGEISSDIIIGIDKVVKYRQWDKKPGQPAVMARMDERDELQFLRE